MSVKQTIILAAVAVMASATSVFAERVRTDQEMINSVLFDIANPPDDLERDDDPYYEPSQRKKDALPRFNALFTERGWTTNQLVEGLITTYTNNIIRESWDVWTYGFSCPRELASMSLIAIAEINHPRSHEFLKSVCTNSTYYSESGYPFYGIEGIYRYSDFGPETMAYMRDVCVHTNMYDYMGGYIASSMVECVQDVTNSYRHTAVTNVARFLYFSLNHTTDCRYAIDYRLNTLVPEYSNSLSRINALNRISSTTTNAVDLLWCRHQLEPLGIVPTNELNDVSWIEVQP